MQTVSPADRVHLGDFWLSLESNQGLDWHIRIDLDRFDIRSMGWCIAGQLGLWEQLEESGTAFVMRLGFDSEYGAEDFDALQSAWHALILKRRLEESPK